MDAPSISKPTRVGLFVTCLVDLFRPNVGFSAVKLLEDAGCVVEVPPEQVCCGQPALNSGDNRDSARIARQVIAMFEPYDYLVAPSGSCAGMIREHYPQLFPASTPWRDRAQALSAKSYELLSFLTDVLGVQGVQAKFDATVTYHDSCSGLRELGVHEQPRALLSSVEGLALRELCDANVCCGFGGTFCVKFPQISERMVSEKVRHINDTDAEVLLGGDLGCLLNMAGRLKRVNSPLRIYHAAEVLAGMTHVPGLGDGEESN